MHCTFNRICLYIHRTAHLPLTSYYFWGRRHEPPLRYTPESVAAPGVSLAFVVGRRLIALFFCTPTPTIRGPHGVSVHFKRCEYTQ